LRLIDIDTYWTEVDRGSGESLVDAGVEDKVLLVQTPADKGEGEKWANFLGQMKEEFPLYREFRELSPGGPLLAWAMYLDTRRARRRKRMIHFVPRIIRNVV